MVRFLSAVSLILSICTTTAEAIQTPQPSPGTPGAPPSQITEKVTVNAQAKAVVDRAIAAYRAMKSYSDVRVGQKIVQGVKADGTPLKEDYKPYTLTFCWQGGSTNPGFRIAAPSGFGAGGDGKTATTWFRTPSKGQGYVQVPYEHRATLPERTKAIRVFYGEHPLLSVFTGIKEGPLMGYVTLDTVRPAERNGVKGQEVIGTSRSFEQPEKTTPLMMFFADDTGLLIEAETDDTKLYNEHYDGDRVFSVVKYTVKMTQIKVDEAIPADRLGFQPEPGAKRFEKIDRYSDMEEDLPPASGLIGQAAPQWKSTDFAGTPIASADYTGKVVVMDFWASWCGPCVLALPHVESLRQSYEPRGVVFLGVNKERNSAGLEKAKKLIADKNIKLKQVIDTGAIGSAYRAHAIPQLVIIDRAGKIHAVHSGFSDSTSKQIEKNLEELLSEPVKPTEPAPPAKR
jgi:thiol-disulfide isomerase/thioredoxin